MKKLKGDVLKVANSLNKRISSSSIFEINDWSKQRELVTDIVIEVTGLDEIDDNDEICLLVNALCEKYNIGISKDDSDIIDSEETINNEKLEDIVFAEYKGGCLSLKKMLEIISNVYEINLNATVVLEDGEELGIVKDVVKDYMFICKDSIRIKPFVSYPEDEDKNEEYECSLEMYEDVFNEVKKYAEEDGIDLSDISEEQLSEYCSTACDNNDFSSTDIVEGTDYSVFQKMKIDLGIINDEDDLICSADEYNSLIDFIENYAEENGIELHECSGNEFRDIINLACENLNIDINSRLEGSIDSIFEKLVEDYDIVIDDEDDFSEMKSYELKEWIESHDEITPEVLNDALNNFENLSKFDYDPSEYERRMYELAEYYEIDEDEVSEYLE